MGDRSRSPDAFPVDVGPWVSLRCTGASSRNRGHGREPGELRIMNRYGDPSRVTCWGSKFDVDGAPSGFGPEIEGVLFGVLHGTAHDLVVPSRSALGFGSAKPLLA